MIGSAVLCPACYQYILYVKIDNKDRLRYTRLGVMAIYNTMQPGPFYYRV